MKLILTFKNSLLFIDIRYSILLLCGGFWATVFALTQCTELLLLYNTRVGQRGKHCLQLSQLMRSVHEL